MGGKRILYKSVGAYLNVLALVHPRAATSRAYRYFSEPRVGRLDKERLPEVLQEAAVSSFRFDHHEVQTYTWPGNERVILLVHGWESNAARWEKMLPYLRRDGSTVIAIDAPAHGLSSGHEFTLPRYAEFIKRAVERFAPDVLVGHSLGGAACVYFQHLHPENPTRKLVILGAPCDLQVLIDNFANMLGLSARLRKRFERYFLDTFAIETRAFSGAAFGKTITVAGIIAHDQDDDVVAFTEAQKMAGSWTHAQFIATKGLGHSMHDAQLYERVFEFLSA